MDFETFDEANIVQHWLTICIKWWVGWIRLSCRLNQLLISIVEKYTMKIKNDKIDKDEFMFNAINMRMISVQ